MDKRTKEGLDKLYEHLEKERNHHRHYLMSYAWRLVNELDIALQNAKGSGDDMLVLEINHILDSNVNNVRLHMYEMEASRRAQAKIEKLVDRGKLG